MARRASGSSAIVEMGGRGLVRDLRKSVKPWSSCSTKPAIYKMVTRENVEQGLPNVLFQTSYSLFQSEL